MPWPSARGHYLPIGLLRLHRRPRCPRPALTRPCRQRWLVEWAPVTGKLISRTRPRTSTARSTPSRGPSARPPITCPSTNTAAGGTGGSHGAAAAKPIMARRRPMPRVPARLETPTPTSGVRTTRPLASATPTRPTAGGSLAPETMGGGRAGRGMSLDSSRLRPTRRTPVQGHCERRNRRQVEPRPARISAC